MLDFKFDPAQTVASATTDSVLYCAATAAYLAAQKEADKAPSLQLAIKGLVVGKVGPQVSDRTLVRAPPAAAPAPPPAADAFGRLRVSDLADARDSA